MTLGIVNKYDISFLISFVTFQKLNFNFPKLKNSDFIVIKQKTARKNLLSQLIIHIYKIISNTLYCPNYFIKEIQICYRYIKLYFRNKKLQFVLYHTNTFLFWLNTPVFIYEYIIYYFFISLTYFSYYYIKIQVNLRC